MSSKKWIKVFLLISIFGIGFVGIINYIVDPLQHYRKASFYKPYSFEQRYLVWGLLKNYDYDSVLIGTSMTENFRKDYIDSELNLNILRVPFSGASAYEENLVMQHALKNKNLSTIIYGLDLFSFRGKETRLRYGKDSLPIYLMNNIIYDDYKYLLNIDIFLKNNTKIFLSNFFGIKQNMINFNQFWAWDYKEKFNKELCIKDYYNNLKPNTKDNYSINELKKSFDYNIIPLLKNNQNLEFRIFFPPYSILTWKSWEHHKYLQDMLEFKKYILRQSIKYKNVKLYDFQIAKEITHNLDNYKDISHYSGKINRWMVQQIKENNYLVTKNNIDKYLKTLKEQIKNYDLNQTLSK